MTPNPDGPAGSVSIRRPVEIRAPLRTAGILLITIVAYLPALRGGFVWDDAAVSKNSLLWSAEGLHRIWTDPNAHPLEEHWWPLLHTSFWIEYQLWGIHPFGYHLVNVLLHAVNSILVWRLLLRLNGPAAWWAAAIFAVHPVHVESVAWVIERKDVLSTLFYLLAVLAFLRFDARQGGPYYPIALLFTACAMLTKSIAVTLPVALALCLWWRRERLAWRDLVPLLPFALLVGGLEYVSLFVMGEPRTLNDPQLDQLPPFAPIRSIIAIRALAFYAAKVIWPVNLMPIYSRWPLDPTSPIIWISAAVVLAVLVALWAARRRIGKGPLAAVLFFLVTLAPTLGLVNFGHLRYAYVADRFAYLPSLGLIALLAAAGASVAGRMKPAALLASRATVTLGLMAMAALTWRQARIYRDNVTFWRFAVQQNPAAWPARYNLGVALSNDDGHLDEAVDVLEGALRQKSDEPGIHNSLGVALAKLGRYTEAGRRFERAIELQPTLTDAHYNLGLLHLRRGQLTSAITALREALRQTPDYAAAHSQLAVALSKIGEIEDAIEHHRIACRLAPLDAETHFQLGLSLTTAGRDPEAVEAFKSALRLRPQWPDARTEMGGALIRAGRVDEGTLHLLEVLKRNPDHDRARWLLQTAKTGSASRAGS